MVKFIKLLRKFGLWSQYNIWGEIISENKKCGETRVE